MPFHLLYLHAHLLYVCIIAFLYKRIFPRIYRYCTGDEYKLYMPPLTNFTRTHSLLPRTNSRRNFHKSNTDEWNDDSWNEYSAWYALLHSTYIKCIWCFKALRCELQCGGFIKVPDFSTCKLYAFYITGQDLIYCNYLNDRPDCIIEELSAWNW